MLLGIFNTCSLVLQRLASRGGEQVKADPTPCAHAAFGQDCFAGLAIARNALPRRDLQQLGAALHILPYVYPTTCIQVLPIGLAVWQVCGAL